MFLKNVSDEVLPVKITEDGNYLPDTGSMRAYGNDNQSVKMRVKII